MKEKRMREELVWLFACIGVATVFIGLVATVGWIIDKVHDYAFYCKCKRLTKTIQKLIADNYTQTNVELSFTYEPESETYISTVNTKEFNLRINLPAHGTKAHANLYFHNNKKNKLLADFIFSLLLKDSSDNHTGFDMLHDFKLLSALAYKRLK